MIRFDFSPDSLRTEITGSMTTSSELQVLPSPTKIRARKTRHRRNNSRGSAKDLTSPIKSPTRELGAGVEMDSSINSSNLSGSHNSLHIPPAHHHTHGTVNFCFQDDHVSPTAFKFLGPATAIREHHTEDEGEGLCREGEEMMAIASPKLPCEKPGRVGTGVNSGNMNDVCFGCDGGCSDATCSSNKRSSQVSADVESSCDSPVRSPLRGGGAHSDYLPSLSTLIDDPATLSPTSCSGVTSVATATTTTTTSSPKPVREKDSNENLNCPEDFTKAQQTATDDLPSGGSNVPVTQDASNAACHLSLKRRTRSEQEGEDPPKRAHPSMQRMDSADSESSVAPQPRRTPGVKFRSIKVTFSWF
jgi:hypothetical protein